MGRCGGGARSVRALCRPRVTNPKALSLDLRFPGSFDTEADAPSRRAGVAH